ncbi:MAG: exodeoxyribonuclease VII large subunit [Burkholderiaceae bacterium]
MADAALISVSELNRLVNLSLNRQFPALGLQAEISQITVAASGHWYLTLKDAQASVRAVMFRREAAALTFEPQVGSAVSLNVSVGLYEPRGEFQVRVLNMQPAGAGGLYEAFIRLQRKLEAEGLFDPARKRPRPSRLRHVGVVTSLSAAALRDFLVTLRLQAPRLRVTVLASLVQGADAPAQLVAALNRTAELDIDALAVVRGGGSLEDLWAFNDESVVRAVVRQGVHVVSGVGHETDVTLVDYAADHRAATPTAAAGWLAEPDLAHRNRLNTLGRDLRLRMQSLLGTLAQRLDRAQALLPNPRRAVALNRMRLEQAARELASARRHWLADAHRRLQRAGDQLQHLGPMAVLGRGYALVTGPNGQVVTHVAAVEPGQALQVVLQDGDLGVRVETLSKAPRF